MLVAILKSKAQLTRRNALVKHTLPHNTHPPPPHNTALTCDTDKRDEVVTPLAAPRYAQRIVQHTVLVLALIGLQQCWQEHTCSRSRTNQHGKFRTPFLLIALIRLQKRWQDLIN